MKNYALKKIGDGWKSKRNTLFNNRNKLGDKTEEEVAAQIPPGVDPEQWKKFVKFRFSPEGRQRSEIGRNSRSQQDVRHTTGSRPFSVVMGEMVRDELL